MGRSHRKECALYLLSSQTRSPIAKVPARTVQSDITVRNIIDKQMIRIVELGAVGSDCGRRRISHRLLIFAAASRREANSFSLHSHCESLPNILFRRSALRGNSEHRQVVVPASVQVTVFDSSFPRCRLMFVLQLKPMVTHSKLKTRLREYLQRYFLHRANTLFNSSSMRSILSQHASPCHPPGQQRGFCQSATCREPFEGIHGTRPAPTR